MAKPNEKQHKDLFETGRAQRNSLFGPESPSAHYPTNDSGGFGSQPPYGGMDPGNSLVPYQPQVPQQTTESSSPLSKLPINEIKQFVERMGGIEGIMNSFQKMNAFMKNVQQMAPMLKLLMGSFMGGKAQTNGEGSSSRRRRRRRRTRSSYGYSSRRPRTGTTRKRKSKGTGTKRRSTTRPRRRRY